MVNKLSYLYIYRQIVFWLVSFLLLIYLFHDYPIFTNELIRFSESKLLSDVNLLLSQFSNPRFYFQRPLSNLLLSVIYNYNINPNFSLFYIVNVIFHFLNAILIFQLLKKLKLNTPLFICFLFLFHPLLVRIVSHIWGLSYILATFFMLLGLNHLFSWPKLSQNERIYFVIIQIILFLLMLMSKQSLIFYPAIVLLIYLHCFSINKKVLFWSTVIIPFLIAYIYCYVDIYIGRDPFNQLYTISQIRIFPYLIGLVFSGITNLPSGTTLIRADILEFQFLFGLTCLSLLIGLALKNKQSILGMSIICLLLSIAPTNSVIIKDQLVSCPRLYPALFFATLIIGVTLDKIVLKVSEWEHYQSIIKTFTCCALCIIHFSFFISLYINLSNEVDFYKKVELRNTDRKTSLAKWQIPVVYLRNNKINDALEYLAKNIDAACETKKILDQPLKGISFKHLSNDTLRQIENYCDSSKTLQQSS